MPESAGPRRTARRIAKRAGKVSVSVASVLPRTEGIERFLLKRWWNRASPEALDRYLVSGYQNPRINLQSIIVRHFLVRRIFGTDPDLEGLMAAEVAFAIELNEELRVTAEKLGVTMGAYLDREKAADVRRVEESIADREAAFADRWRAALEGRSGARLAVLELACGSANDYRAFAEYGIADHLDYLGIDLTPKNIDNARRRFPGIGFEVGDITALDAADASFDYVIAFDIFEHLSPEAIEHALDEATRVARRGLALTFFNMDDIAEHQITPRGVYYWNKLSRSTMEARLRPAFPTIESIRIGTWLSSQHGYERTYNSHAVTMFAER
jgi:ubiquinone/menaquinone biosynthesis C-methylase UbiE